MDAEYHTVEVREKLDEDNKLSGVVAVVDTDSLNPLQHKVKCDVLNSDQLAIDSISFNTDQRGDRNGRKSITIEELTDLLNAAVEGLNVRGYAVEATVPNRLNETFVASESGSVQTDSNTEVMADD